MIIGISGFIGSGKTTAANYLVQKGFKEYSMAGPLKKIAEIFHFELHQLYGTQEQKLELNKYWNISGREFLQKFGTEICRNYLPKAIPNMNIQNSIWIRLFEIEMEKNPTVNYVISDVRFLDEAEFIRQKGGIVVQISRTLLRSSDEHSHCSELEINNITPDCIIDNNGTIEQLYKQLDNLEN